MTEQFIVTMMETKLSHNTSNTSNTSTTSNEHNSHSQVGKGSGEDTKTTYENNSQSNVINPIKITNINLYYDTKWLTGC